MSEYSTTGAHFGNINIEDKSLVMKDVNTNKTTFSMELDNVAQCVLPQNNRYEVELQFHENDMVEDDSLVQITFHFPKSKVVKSENADSNADNEVEADNEDEDETLAEQFQQRIVSTGVIRTLTSNVIVEFTREQGTFVAPRGKYLLQVRYMHSVCCTHSD